MWMGMFPYAFETTVSNISGLFISPFGLGGSFRDEFYCCVGVSGDSSTPMLQEIYLQSTPGYDFDVYR
jgi:hypothetical protein